MAHLREILTFYQCDKCEAKFPTRQLAVDHKCAKRAEALKHSHNKPMPFAQQIFDEVAVVVPLDYLPYNTMAVSKKLYDELAASGDIVPPKTSA